MKACKYIQVMGYVPSSMISVKASVTKLKLEMEGITVLRKSSLKY